MGERSDVSKRRKKEFDIIYSPRCWEGDKKKSILKQKADL